MSSSAAPLQSSASEASARGLQVFRFSTASYRPHDRVAAWREVFGRTVLHIDLAPRAADRFRANAIAFRSSTFGLVHATTSATNQANSRELIASDDISFGIVTTCRWGASQRGRSLDLHPGDGVLLSNDEVGGITLPNECRYVAFCVPRSALTPLVQDIGVVLARRVPAASPALQLLGRYLDLSRSEQLLSTPELAAAYTSHVCDLLAMCLGATRDGAEVAKSRGLNAARLHTMKEDIGRNLGRPDLSVHWIAERYKLSVRYVQKLFEESGSTFTRFLMDERLDAAREALRTRSDIPVSAIAYDLGFGDLSNFNRAFRQRFGCTPRDVREVARPSGTGEA